MMHSTYDMHQRLLSRWRFSPQKQTNDVRCHRGFEKSHPADHRVIILIKRIIKYTAPHQGNLYDRILYLLGGAVGVEKSIIVFKPRRL